MMPQPHNIIAQFKNYYVLRGLLRYTVVRYESDDKYSLLHMTNRWFWRRSAAVRFAQDLRESYCTGTFA